MAREISEIDEIRAIIRRMEYEIDIMNALLIKQLEILNKRIELLEAK